MTGDGTGPRAPVEVLAADWERLRRAAAAVRPLAGETDRELEEEVARRGAELIDRPAPPDRVDPLLTGPERVAALREVLVRRAATLAVHRFDYAAGRDRFAAAGEAEERAYVRKLALDRDVVPPLKEEAKALRAEIRRLERALVEAGGDPASVPPAIEWGTTLAVDAYVRPGYETPETRRRRAVEFFRRIGP